MKDQRDIQEARRAAITEWSTKWPGIFAGAVERLEERSTKVASSASTPTLHPENAAPTPDADEDRRLMTTIATAEREVAALRLANGTLRRQLKEQKINTAKPRPCASSAAMHQILNETERSAAVNAGARNRAGPSGGGSSSSTLAAQDGQQWNTEGWLLTLGLPRLIAEQLVAKLRSRSPDLRHERAFIAALGGLSSDVMHGLVFDSTLNEVCPCSRSYARTHCMSGVRTLACTEVLHRMLGTISCSLAHTRTPALLSSQVLADAIVEGAGAVAAAEAFRDGKPPPPRHPTHRFSSAERVMLNPSRAPRGSHSTLMLEGGHNE